MTAGTATQTYTYDNFGNILTANGNSYEYTDSLWKDKLTVLNDVEIEYDDSGNPEHYYNGTHWTFTWTEGRNLTTASGGGNTISYQYDSNGIRTSKTVNGVTHEYIYAGGKLIRETITTGDEVITMDFIYDANGRPYAMYYNDTMYYYVLNLQGDVMWLTGANGVQQAAYTYDVWGNVSISENATEVGIANPLRYRGYYYDAESGFYYLQSRYYDPQIGRFINADSFASTGQGFIGYNMFAYCGNNPVNYTDPYGLFAKFLQEFLEAFTEWVPTPLGMLRYVFEYTKKGNLYEYWVDNNGQTQWSRHHSDHGNAKEHKYVPHDHQWYDDDDGNHTQDPNGLPPNPGFQSPQSINRDQASQMVASSVGIVLACYVLYVGTKWAIAAFAAPVTGGGSLIVAGVTP